MKIAGHFITSLIGAGLVYSIFGNFISGFLIDLGHIPEYLRDYGLKNLNITTFCKSCYENRLAKALLFLHSFELLFILWILITVFKLNIIWITLALGVTMHLIIDQFSNRILPLSYFFTYRCSKDFNIEMLFPRGKI